MPDSIQRIAEALGLDYEVGGRSLLLWIIAVLIGGAAYTILELARWQLRRRLEHWAKSHRIRERLGWVAISRLRWWFLLIVSITVAINLVVLPWERGSALAIALVVASAVQALLLVVPIIDVFVERFLQRHRSDDPHAAEIATSAGILRFIGLVIAFSMVFVVAAQNLGIDVTALIAGLGVGGIAIALAVQSVLGDLFAALSIVLDKPFVVGDFIVVDKQMGTVERVGLKTTRVRANTGEQLVFGNADLLKSRIQNFKRMQERWVLNTVRVDYSTHEAQLSQLPGVFKRIVESKSQVRFDRSHLARLGEGAIEFEFAFYMLTADYNIYMNTQQAINLEVYRECRQRGIRIVVPGRAIDLAASAGVANAVSAASAAGPVVAAPPNAPRLDGEIKPAGPTAANR